MELLDTITAALEGLDQATETFAYLVVLATVVTALIPSRSDNILANRILFFLNLLAGNVGRNKNADDL
ncbi:MAG: hypothetical protein MI743_05450 [Sneathiellales bacterium]|nr:hypothetical protein [Sneathiellales bacterium]